MKAGLGISIKDYHLGDWGVIVWELMVDGREPIPIKGIGMPPMGNGKSQMAHGKCVTTIKIKIKIKITITITMLIEVFGGEGAVVGDFEAEAAAVRRMQNEAFGVVVDFNVAI